MNLSKQKKKKTNSMTVNALNQPNEMKWNDGIRFKFIEFSLFATQTHTHSELYVNVHTKLGFKIPLDASLIVSNEQ